MLSCLLCKSNYDRRNLQIVLILLITLYCLYCLDLGFTKDIDHPVRDINKIIKIVSEKDTSNTINIFLFDEVKPMKENKSWKDFDLSFLDLSRLNIDLLMALNPVSSKFKGFRKGYKIIQHKHSNTLACQLYMRHRNNYETAVFVDHWVAYFKSKYGYLDPSNDIPLDPDTLPPGRLPLWIQRSVNVSDQEVLDFIKTEYVLDNETVTIIYGKYCKEIDIICQQNQWKFINNHDIYGSEDQVIILYDFNPFPEHISRAKKSLIFVTTIG